MDDAALASNSPRFRAVTFDFGQTLAELDTTMLRGRLAARGLEASTEALDAAVPFAWEAYNAAIRAGHGGHPWKLLMATLLGRAGVEDAAVGPTVDWLLELQPRSNLWRRPIAGMIEVVRDLRGRGVAVGVVSNSEGGLAGLIAEMGWTAEFDAVADSGVLGMEKPDRAIFDWTAGRLGVPVAETVHVGDAWAADYLGALGCGMGAVLFRGEAFVPPGMRVGEGDREACCTTPEGLREALRAWGLLGA